MPRICDRSPCNGLIGALGEFVFGALTKDKLPRPDGFFMLVYVDGKAQEIEIEYCPFCGTQIQQVNDIVVERFMRPRRRRVTAKKREGVVPLPRD